MIATYPRIWLSVLLSGLAATGCHPRDGRTETRPRELMHTSFEEFVGWGPEVAPLLATDKAHSGKFSIRVDPQHPYSPTFRAALGKLCPTHRPRRLTLSAWVWVPSYQDQAVIVAAIANANDLDHPIFRKNIYLTDIGPLRKWKQVSRDLNLPPDIRANSQLTIYLWKSNANEPVYADDLQLTELW